MTKYYYYNHAGVFFQSVFLIRMFGVFLFFFGISIVLYVFSPLIIWQFTLAPVFADSHITSPVPRSVILTPSVLKSLIASSLQHFSGADFSNASNWFPTYAIHETASRVPNFFLSIPKLAITNAYVSTEDMNLADHLVNLAGTAIPPDKGNTVIFGHSTLPEWFNPKDYKTIFADAYTLQVGDTMTTTVENVVYTYKIFSITIVDPEDTSVLEQQYDDSYLTLITCTPPGTIWKRLIIKARLQKLS
jgi:sortase A